MVEPPAGRMHSYVLFNRKPPQASMGAGARLSANGEQAPLPCDAAELVHATVLEGNACVASQFHGQRGDEYLAWASEGQDARRLMDRDSVDIVPGPFNFA